MIRSFSAEETGEVVFCLQPSRPVLCVTKNPDGSDHVAPFGWCTPVSQFPPMIAIAILDDPAKKEGSLRNIERTGEFTVNLPDMEIADKLVETSYKTKLGENKFERSGFTRMPSQKVEPVCVAQCRAFLECRTETVLHPGDHAVIIARVVNARYDDEAFGRHMLIDTRRFRPVIHLQNVNVREADSQLHMFLKADCTEVVQVPFPSKNE